MHTPITFHPDTGLPIQNERVMDFSEEYATAIARVRKENIESLRAQAHLPPEKWYSTGQGHVREDQIRKVRRNKQRRRRGLI